MKRRFFARSQSGPTPRITEALLPGTDAMIQLLCTTSGCGGAAPVVPSKEGSGGVVRCSACGKTYELNAEVMGKVRLMEEFRGAVRRARPILGSASVGIAAGGQEVKIPYNILVGRLPVEMAFDFGKGAYRFLFAEEEETPGAEKGGTR